VFTVTEEGPALTQRAALVPLLEGKATLLGEPTAFVCEHGRCELPTSDPDTFARQLAKVTPFREPAGP
jgi:uncharacterized protein YyaL (SSP411 family)